ncbi:MAG: AraC family transcriptional regulator [Halioglobus sp.]
MQSDAPPSSTPSTIAAYAFAITTALEQRGVDPQLIFEQCNIPIQTTTDPMLRLTNIEISSLFKASVAATYDPAFGLQVGEVMHPGNLHALGYALMASTSLRDYAQRLSNYYKIVSQSADITIEEVEDEFLLITQVIAPDICWETQDAYSALMIRFIRFIYNPSFNPLRVELMRPEPSTDVQKYRDYFNCDIVFDSPKMVFAIAPELIDMPLPGASRELAQMHDQTTMQYLKRMEKQDIINRVRTMIVEELSSSAITKQRVADKLCMSSRSLQMKLAAKDTSFQEILDGTRHSLALGYMEQSAISITEAAYLLGFSDVSNFTRAFKRWTEKSPREFRQSLGLDH